MVASYNSQMLLTLSGVAIILYLALKYSKKAVEGKFSGEIKVIDRKVVDNGATLVMVKVRKKEYLLGMSAKGIYVLDTLEESHVSNT